MKKMTFNSSQRDIESTANHESLEAKHSPLFRKLAGLAVGMASIAVVPSSTLAAITTVDIPLTQSISGAAPQSTTQPWMDAMFQDLSANKVLLTITAPNLTGSERDKSFYLNFNDSKTVTSLVFTPVYASWQGVANVSSVQTGKNQFKANGGGNYDIQLDFQTSGGPGAQFTGGDKVVYEITSTTTSFSSVDFAVKSQLQGGGGTFYAAANIDGANPSQKGFIAAPTFSLVAIPEVRFGFAAASLCIGAILIRLRKTKPLVA